MITTFREIETYHFLLLLFSTFIAGGIIIAGLCNKFLNKSNPLAKSYLILLGVGISPYFISTLLYYLFILFPNQTDRFYLLLIYTPYIIFFVISFSSIKELLKYLFNFISSLFFKKKLLFVFTLFFSILVFVYWGYYINSKFLTEHDTLEYAVQGKVFYEDKTISYETNRYDEENGFYYVGLHGFSFPLLATFERMNNTFLGNSLGNSKDYFFRSLNSIFGLLILLGIFLYSFKNKNIYFAIFTSLALLFTYGFFETIMKYHIDNYRIFYFLCTIFLMQKFIENNSFQRLLLFSLFLAAQANAHSLGFMLAIIQLGVVFFFINGTIFDKLKKISLITSIMFVLGGIHYLLDIFIGTGWIFQDIKFY